MLCTQSIAVKQHDDFRIKFVQLWLVVSETEGKPGNKMENRALQWKYNYNR